MRAPPARAARSADPGYAILVPGAEALAASADAVGLVRSWVRAHGFDGLTCFQRSADDPQGVVDLWSTWDPAWNARWLAAGHARVDPRVVGTGEQGLPCMWDGGMMVTHAALARFLADAAAAGIRSGVAVPLHGPGARTVVAFDAGIAPVDAARREATVAALPQLLWVAHAVHAFRRGRAAREDDRRLSSREQRCLAMSASGLTSRAIGLELGIAPRTVDFHVRNGAAKLGAANRREAIAKAAARGLIRP